MRLYMKEEFDSSLLLQNYYTIKTGGIEDYSPNISNNRWKGFFYQEIVHYLALLVIFSLNIIADTILL